MDAAGIAAVARGAGLTDPGQVATAVAVALAESGGNTNSHNGVAPDNSYGLWQINMLGPMGPARRKALGISSNDQLYDPAINAKAMMMISGNGRNFRPWTTFTTGKYLTRMGEAQSAAGTTSRGSTSGAGAQTVGLIPDSLNPLSGISDGIGAVQNWVTDRHNWIRVGWVALGVGFIIVGAVSVTKGTPVAAIAGKAAKAAVVL